MRIALLHSTGDARTSREREPVHELAAALADRGHDVTLLTGDRGRSVVPDSPAVAMVRCWTPPALPTERYYEEHIAQVPSLLWHLIRGRFDVAHAFFTAGAWAVAQARRLGGPPLFFSFDESPDRRYLVARHYRLEMLRVAVEAASECMVWSEPAARSFERHLLRRPRVPPRGGPGHGVDVEVLAPWLEALYRAATGSRARGIG